MDLTNRTADYRAVGRWLNKKMYKGFDFKRAAFQSSMCMDIPIRSIRRWLTNGNLDFRVAAMRGCMGRMDVPLELIKQGLDDKEPSVKVAALKACKYREDVPLELLEQERMFNDNPDILIEILRVYGLREDVSADYLEKFLFYKDRKIREAAADACSSKKIPIKILESVMLDSHDTYVEATIMGACAGRKDVPLKLLERGMNSGHSEVIAATLYACIGRKDVPIAFLEQGLHNRYLSVRTPALYACVGRKDAPLELIEQGIRDGYHDDYHRIYSINHFAGFDAMNKFKKVFPHLFKTLEKRAFEPPAQVYRRCLDDVIVVAEIPQDACVIGEPEMFSTNKVKIVDIIGNFDGEKIGVESKVEFFLDSSKLHCYDYYLIGDEMEMGVSDSGFCDDPRTGLRFSCTLEEVKKRYVL